jgi:hypothetical protein
LQSGQDHLVVIDENKPYWCAHSGNITI